MPKAQRIISAVQAVDILKEYQNGATMKELAEKYNTSRMTISRTVTRSGGNPRAAHRPSMYTNDQKKQIRKRYENGETLRNLAIIYGGHYSNIAQVIRKDGGKLRTRGRPRVYKKGILSWLDS